MPHEHDKDEISAFAGEYEGLTVDRSQYLERARDCAEVTMPYLIPRSGQENDIFKTPWQSLGARGVKNLSSKLLLALFPPNNPFFRFRIDEFKFKELGGTPELKLELEDGLADVERAIMTEVETASIRIGLFNALKLLIVGGNALIFLPKKGNMRVFQMDRYVVERDPAGNVIKIMTKENLAFEALETRIQNILENSADYDPTKDIEIFTRIIRKDNKWEVMQEVAGIIIEELSGTFAIDKSPYLPLRITKLDGEHWGPSIVEESLGDLMSLERLAQAGLQAAEAASRGVFFVNPLSNVSVKELTEAKNWGYVVGNAEDVQALEIGKSNDFRQVEQAVARLENALSFQFLLNSSVQRQAERVTAEEIRFMAQELEDALGGVYSVLSQELQLPLVRMLMERMSNEGRLPEFPKDIIKPSIVTGVEALGRSSDQSKLTQALALLGQFLPPELLATRLEIGALIDTVFINHGIDSEGLIKSEEQIQAEQQQQQQMAMMQQAMPNMINQGGDIMKGAVQENIAAQQEEQQ